MTTFLLIRHGETGIEEKRQKPEDFLSEEGIGQVKKLAKKVKHFSIKSVYASPYQRAFQTAKMIASAYVLPLVSVTDDRLAEIGLWVNPSDLYDDTSSEYKKGFAILGEAQKGVGELLRELRERHKDEVIALVCHGNIIRGILGYALKMNLETVVRLKVDLASLSILEWTDEGYFRLSLFNCIGHLKSSG